MTAEWVFFDFYGTLARATRWMSADEVLAGRGYVLTDEARAAFYGDNLDGVEHDEHSQSRDHYVAWQRSRAMAMLASTDVHSTEYEQILELLRRGSSERVIEAYDEVPDTLRSVRALGVGVAVCSNWDWDLDIAVDDAGLTDLLDIVVSSAWVGARKPHPRIFDATLEKCSTTPERVLFVGDTWGPDVEGPLSVGIRPIYLRRAGHWDDGTCPHDDPYALPEVRVLPDLRGVVDAIESA
jgi:putative hydrolase of the HAD superfamily